MAILISTTIVTASTGPARPIAQLEFAWTPPSSDEGCNATIQALKETPELQADLIDAVYNALIAINATRLLSFATRLLLVQGGQVKLALSKADLQPLLPTTPPLHDPGQATHSPLHEPARSSLASTAIVSEVTCRCHCRIVLPRWLEILELSPAVGPVTGGTLIQVKLAGRSCAWMCRCNGPGVSLRWCATPPCKILVR